MVYLFSLFLPLWSIWRQINRKDKENQIWYKHDQKANLIRLYDNQPRKLGIVFNELWNPALGPDYHAFCFHVIRIAKYDCYIK